MHEAKTHLSRLLDDVRNGEEIILAKAGKPYVRSVPIEPLRRELGFLPALVGAGDQVLEPLDEAELESYENPT